MQSTERVALQDAAGADSAGEVACVMSAMVMLDAAAGGSAAFDGSLLGGGCFLESEVGLAYWLEDKGRCEPMMGHFGVRVAERLHGWVFEFVYLGGGRPQIEREIPVLKVKAIAQWSDRIHEDRDQLNEAIVSRALH